MSPEGTGRFLAVLKGDPGARRPTLETLCLRVLEILPATGASIVLMSGGKGQGLAGASGESASTNQDLEFTLGEGPGIDAFGDGRTVLVDDLQATGGRWPVFSESAVGHGVRSVCALPLQVGSIRLGVLSLYAPTSAAFGGEHLADAHLVADLVTHMLIELQSEAVSESVAFALDVSDYRAVVHQATGKVSAQLDCDVGEALLRLRGRAFSTGRPIDELAKEVVDGSVRFDEL